MDICVRCGACADKCHFYIGSGDPKNMPVLRAELMRSVYRRYFTLDRPALRRARGRPRADRRRHQGVVLLLLSVHRVPPLFGLLPLWHRHGRDHHDGPRVAGPDRLQHQLGHGAGRQLLPHRQPSRHPAAWLSKTASNSPPMNRGNHGHAESKFRSIARAQRFFSSCPRPTTLPLRITTRCSAT